MCIWVIFISKFLQAQRGLRSSLHRASGPSILFYIIYLLHFIILHFICFVSTCMSIYMPCGDQVTTCRRQVSPSAKWVPGIKIIVGSLYLISQSFQPLTSVSDSVSGILLFPFVKCKRHMRKFFCGAIIVLPYLLYHIQRLCLMAGCF